MSKVDEIIKRLQADSEVKYPKHSPIAHLLANQAQVRACLEKRVEKKKIKLLRVAEIEYHFKTGLAFTCFEFDENNPLEELSDFLVVSDGNCQVVSVVENFDKKQPNPHVPPLPDLPKLPADGAVPFAAARPSFSGKLEVTPERKYALQIRVVEFFNQLQMNAEGNESETTCTYETGRETQRICIEATTVGPWGYPSVCDRWEDREIVTTDTSVDDSSID